MCETSQYLVDKVLDVFIAECLTRLDNLVKIGCVGKPLDTGLAD